MTGEVDIADSIMSFSGYLLSEVKVSLHQDFEVDVDAVNERVAG